MNWMNRMKWNWINWDKTRLKRIKQSGQDKMELNWIKWNIKLDKMELNSLKWNWMNWVT